MATNNSVNNTGTTQAAGDNTTKVATTSFVQAALPPINHGMTGYFCGLPGAFGGTISNNLTQGMNMNTNIHLMPFYLSADLTVSAIRTFVTVGVAASTITMGIYNAQTSGLFLPTGAVISAASIASTASTTVVTATLNAPLIGNRQYWAAIQVSTNTVLSVNVNSLNMHPGNFFSNNGTTGYYPTPLLYANTYSAGTLPSITPGSLIAGGAVYGPVMNVS